MLPVTALNHSYPVVSHIDYIYGYIMRYLYVPIGTRRGGLLVHDFFLSYPLDNETRFILFSWSFFLFLGFLDCLTSTAC